MSADSAKPSSSLRGRWHLVAEECPDDHIPGHRVDLVFHDEPTGLRGAILSRADGSEIPLQTVTFWNGELRLKMAGASGATKHGAASVVRFWLAFRDFKHGKAQSLRRKEEELERALAGARHGA